MKKLAEIAFVSFILLVGCDAEDPRVDSEDIASEVLPSNVTPKPCIDVDPYPQPPSRFSVKRVANASDVYSLRVEESLICVGTIGSIEVVLGTPMPTIQ